MPDYVRYPIDFDPDAKRQEWVERLQEYWPNFEPAEGSLAWRAASSIIEIIAEGLEIASYIPDEIVRWLGANIFNLPSYTGIAATASTKWTMIDGVGHETIPTGTLLSIGGVFFQTTQDLVIPPGPTLLEHVPIEALVEGTGGNDLGAADDEISLETPYDFVLTVQLEGATANGQDQELLADYLTRFRTRLTLMSPRVITTQNLVTMAQTIPGVTRAVALKGYNPDDETFDNAGHAAVALHGADGLGVSPTIKTAVSDAIVGPGERIVNQTLHIADPTWTPVDVTADVTAEPGADAAEVEAAAIAALQQLFDPRTWGRPTQGEAQAWNRKTDVNIFDVAGALDRVIGLDTADSIAIGLDGGAQNDDLNHALPGVFPLPLAGDIVVNVSLP